MSTHTHPGRARILVGALLAVVAVTTMTALPASAHTSLVSSDPADGSMVTTPPAQITLTFDEALMQSADTVSVNDSAGNVIASVQVQPTGAVLSVPWPADLRPGDYEIAYRAVADDGHPAIGALHFTYAGSPASVASATTATPGTASASPDAAGTSTVTATDTGTGAGTDEASTTGGGSSMVMLGIILLAAIVVLGFVLTLRRRKRT